MSIFNTESSYLIPEREVYFPELFARLHYATERESYKAERAEMKEKPLFSLDHCGLFMPLIVLRIATLVLQAAGVIGGFLSPPHSKGCLSQIPHCYSFFCGHAYSSVYMLTNP